MRITTTILALCLAACLAAPLAAQASGTSSSGSSNSGANAGTARRPRGQAAPQTAPQAAAQTASPGQPQGQPSAAERQRMMEQYRQQGRGAAGAAGAAEPSGAEPPGAGGRPGHHHEVDSREEYERMKNESNTDYLWRKSDQAFHDGDYERAVALHRAIVVLDPADFESYSVAAWLLWSMGRGDDAMQFLGQGLKANPNEWEMWDAAGQHYDVVKRAREAKEAFARAVQLIPKEQNSQMLRRRFAHAAEKSGDVQTSLETWRALTRDFPGQQVNQNNLARLERVAAGQEKPRTVNEQ